MKILRIETIHCLQSESLQIRVKLFNKVVFKLPFKSTLKPI